MVMGVVAMGARSRFIAPVMDLNRRRVCCARAARESSTSAVVIVGGAVAGLLRGRLSASSVDVSPLRSSVSRRFTAARKDSPARGGGQDVGIKAEGGTPQDCFGIIGGVVSCQRCRPNSAEHGSVCAARRSRDLFRLYSEAWAEESGGVRREGSAKTSGSSGNVVGGCLWDQLQSAIESAGFTGSCGVGGT